MVLIMDLIEVSVNA